MRRFSDPAECVRGRTLYGGTAPDEVLAQVVELKEELKQNREVVAKMHAHLKKAAEKLEGAIDAILGTYGESKKAERREE